MSQSQSKSKSKSKGEGPEPMHFFKPRPFCGGYSVLPFLPCFLTSNEFSTFRLFRKHTNEQEYQCIILTSPLHPPCLYVNTAFFFKRCDPTRVRIHNNGRKITACGRGSFSMAIMEIPMKKGETPPDPFFYPPFFPFPFDRTILK